jgi:hypothetical protein
MKIITLELFSYGNELLKLIGIPKAEMPKGQPDRSNNSQLPKKKEPK